jgi:mRNA interferase RelE/StbE
MYRIKLRRRAEKDFEKLPSEIAGAVRRKMDSLAENPRPHDSKKVKAMPGYLRIRSGEYRILYQIDDKEKLAIVARIRHRREAYR